MTSCGVRSACASAALTKNEARSAQPLPVGNIWVCRPEPAQLATAARGEPPGQLGSDAWRTCCSWLQC
jgi:hypothetical protein